MTRPPPVMFGIMAKMFIFNGIISFSICVVLGFQSTVGTNDFCHTKSILSSHTTHPDEFTFSINVSSPQALIEDISLPLLACSKVDQRHIRRARWTIHFHERHNPFEQFLTYAENFTADYDDVQKSLHFKFSQPMFAKTFWLSANDVQVKCGRPRLQGCLTRDMCPGHEEVCNYDGLCIGDHRCSCPVGMAGQSCEVQSENITIDDFTPVTQIVDMLFTKSAVFNIVGNVSLSNDTHLTQSISSTKKRTFGIATGFLMQLLGGHVTHSNNQNHHHLHINFGHPASHSPFSVFNNIFGGFSHSSHVWFGHNHSPFQTSYLYTTHGHYYTSNVGASLRFNSHHLSLVVNLGHKLFKLRVPFLPKPWVKYHVATSYCPSSGLSLYINGQLKGSNAHPLLGAWGSLHIPQLPLCFGNCGPNIGVSGHHMILSNTVAVGACIRTVAQNSLLGALGTPLLNLLTHNNYNNNNNNNHQQTSTSPPGSSTPPAATSTNPTQSSTALGATATSKQPQLPHVTSLMTNVTNSYATSGQRGLICYDCNHQSQDGQCSALKQCSSSEICAAFHDQNGYVHECMDVQTCQVGQTSSNKCWQCCASHTCNKLCTAQSQTVSTVHQPTTMTVQQTTTTVPSMCSDRSTCASLKAAGYSVCTDPIVSTSVCMASCNHCPSG